MEENIIAVKDRIFAFEDENGNPVKTKKVSFEILSNSKEFVPGSGKPQASRPEASWITLQKIISLLDIRSIPNEIEAIYISSDEANHPLTTEERAIYGDQYPIKLWIFNRIIAKITLQIPDQEDNGTTKASIAYSYNKNGIQIAFGTHVNICSNFTILSGRVFQTYGDEKIEYDQIMNSVADFIENLPAWQAEEAAMIQHLIDTPAGELSDMNELIGILLRMAVQANIDGETAALNVTEVSEFVKQLISDTSEIRNAWDLMNVGTQILNFSGKVNLMDAISKHVMWKNVMMKKYPLPVA